MWDYYRYPLHISNLKWCYFLLGPKLTSYGSLLNKACVLVHVLIILLLYQFFFVGWDLQANLGGLGWTLQDQIYVCIYDDLSSWNKAIILSSRELEKERASIHDLVPTLRNKWHLQWRKNVFECFLIKSLIATRCGRSICLPNLDPPFPFCGTNNILCFHNSQSRRWLCFHNSQSRRWQSWVVSQNVNMKIWTWGSHTLTNTPTNFI